MNQTEICFTVHAPGDTTPYDVRGTLFSTRQFDRGRTVMLLQHGAFSERSAWNGAQPTVDDAPAVAPMLAAFGQGVITVDRLGYGQSKYPAISGLALDGFAYTNMTAEMVEQIHDGTYRLFKNGSCSTKTAAFGNSDVVLVGFSAGSGIGEYYATQHHDVAGVVSLSWSEMGVSDVLVNLLNTVAVPQLYAGNTYPSGIPDTATCEADLFYVPGMDPRALAELCSSDYYLDPTKNTSPAGELINAPNVMAATATAAANIGDTPLLKIYADHDAFFPNAMFHGADGTAADVVTPDIQLWQSAAQDFQYSYAYNAGHNSWFAESAPFTAGKILFWLYQHGLY